MGTFKSFCTPEETIKWRQPTDWEKICANDVTNKRLVSKIYKQLMMLNSIKTNSPLKKWAEDLNRHFSKENMQMANRHMRGCSTLLIIRELQIKTTMWYYLLSVRNAIIKKNINDRYWQVCEEKRMLVNYL